jgi:hypothetical protein
VRQVLINGTAATGVWEDPLMRFEHVIVADTMARTFTVVAVAENGQRFEARFAMSPPPAPAAPPRPPPVEQRPPVSTPPTTTGSQRPPVSAPSPPAGSQRPASPSQPQAPNNPWKPFRIRGALYAIAAVGGVVLGSGKTSSEAEECRNAGGGQDCFIVTTTKPSFAAGIPIAGAALAIGLIDAVMTSKTAGSASRSASARLLGATSRLTVSPVDGRATVSLLRLSF